LAGYYLLPLLDEIKRITTSAAQYAAKSKECWFILVFNGVYACTRYEYDHHTKSVLGGKVALSVEKFLQMTPEERILIYYINAEESTFSFNSSGYCNRK
jgi:hypothetical protein